MAILIQK